VTRENEEENQQQRYGAGIESMAKRIKGMKRISEIIIQAAAA